MHITVPQATLRLTSLNLVAQVVVRIKVTYHYSWYIDKQEQTAQHTTYIRGPPHGVL